MPNMMSPIVMPPPPSGLGDVALVISIIENKDTYKKYIAEITAIRAQAEAAIAKVGKAEDVDRLHDEADRLVAEKNATLETARREADAMRTKAQVDVASIVAGAGKDRDEAAAILAQAKTDVAARNKKAAEREREVELVEADLAGRTTALEALETASAAREQAVTLRENELSARAAKIAAAVS